MNLPSTSCPTIDFWEGFDERHAFEMTFRGYLSGVVVVTPDGIKHSVYFTDLTRLAQNLEDQVKDGAPFFAEPKMIVLKEVTLENINLAVDKLWRTGFF